MTTLYWIGLGIVLLLAVYLFVALFKRGVDARKKNDILFTYNSLSIWWS